MANINQVQKIDYAILHDPRLIRLLFKDCSISNGLIVSRLKRAVPYRVGIEIECCGSLTKYLKEKYPGSINLCKTVAGFYKIKEFKEDYIDCNSDKFNELRISLTNFRELEGLYNILEDIKQACMIPEGGGIHIHLDFKRHSSDNERKVVQRFIQKRLSEVEDIFPKYEGNYNKRKVGIEKKATYVNLSYHKTIEFRIAPLTFDYNTLITWIIKCNKFISKIINRCHLDSNSYKNYKFDSESSNIRIHDYSYSNDLLPLPDLDNTSPSNYSNNVDTALNNHTTGIRVVRDYSSGDFMIQSDDGNWWSYNDLSGSFTLA